VDYHWEVYATYSIRRLQSGCDAAIEKKRMGQSEHWVPMLSSSGSRVRGIKPFAWALNPTLIGHSP